MYKSTFIEKDLYLSDQFNKKKIQLTFSVQPTRMSNDISTLRTPLSLLMQ